MRFTDNIYHNKLFIRLYTKTGGFVKSKNKILYDFMKKAENKGEGELYGGNF